MSPDLENYVKSNLNFYKNTFSQALIKPKIDSASYDLDINFGNYNHNKPPANNLNGIDRIKKSIQGYYEFNNFSLKVDSEELIRGLIQEYERINRDTERGVIIFFIPFTTRYRGFVIRAHTVHRKSEKIIKKLKVYWFDNWKVKVAN